MSQNAHREMTFAWTGVLLLGTSNLIGYSASTMHNQFYASLTDSMALMMTIFGVPLVFFGLLKRVDIPPHSRAGIPTEKIHWSTAPESLLMTMFVYEGLHLTAVFVEQHALALQDLWGERGLVVAHGEGKGRAYGLSGELG